MSVLSNYVTSPSAGIRLGFGPVSHYMFCLPHCLCVSLALLLDRTSHAAFVLHVMGLVNV